MMERCHDYPEQEQPYSIITTYHGNLFEVILFLNEPLAVRWEKEVDDYYIKDIVCIRHQLTNIPWKKIEVK